MKITRENATAYVPLLQAYAEGKTIQLLLDGWRDLSDPDFSGEPQYYRIKPDFEVDQETIDEAYDIWNKNDGNAWQSMTPAVNFAVNKIVKKIKAGEISLDDF